MPYYTVCLDPGHPSEVGEGTRGKKVTEMGVVWRVALLMKPLLEQAGVHVVMTKQSEKQLVKNRARAEIANRARADLMVRLHCDSDAGSGFATYAPDRAGKSGSTRGPSPDVIARSRKMGRVFHETLAQWLSNELADRGYKNDLQTAVGAKQGALTGSVFSHVPVVLVEMCVLTNPKDEAFVSNPSGLMKLADALTWATLAALRDERKMPMPLLPPQPAP